MKLQCVVVACLLCVPSVSCFYLLSSLWSSSSSSLSPPSIITTHHHHHPSSSPSCYSFILFLYVQSVQVTNNNMDSSFILFSSTSRKSTAIIDMINVYFKPQTVNVQLLTCFTPTGLHGNYYKVPSYKNMQDFR